MQNYNSSLYIEKEDKKLPEKQTTRYT